MKKMTMRVLAREMLRAGLNPRLGDVSHVVNQGDASCRCKNLADIEAEKIYNEYKLGKRDE